MRDFPSCFGENGVQVADTSCSNVVIPNRASQNLVTSIYQSKLLGKTYMIIITWTKSLMGQSLGFEINDLSHKCLSRIDVKPSIFSKRKGSKSVELNPNFKIDFFWDFSIAKFGSGPDPIGGFYLAMVCNGEMAMLIGDMKKEAFKKTNANPSLTKSILISKREHIFGKRVFNSKAQFSDDGEIHEILIESNAFGTVDPWLSIRLDGRMAIRIGNLRWKFRGNQTISVDGLPVEVFWDVHDWLFGGGFGNAVFLFQTCFSAEKLWNCQTLPKVPGLGFSLILHAWKE